MRGRKIGIVTDFGLPVDSESNHSRTDSKQAIEAIKLLTRFQNNLENGKGIFKLNIRKLTKSKRDSFKENGAWEKTLAD